MRSASNEHHGIIRNKLTTEGPGSECSGPDGYNGTGPGGFDSCGSEEWRFA
jgi:hypothetical protein